MSSDAFLVEANQAKTTQVMISDLSIQWCLQTYVCQVGNVKYKVKYQTWESSDVHFGKVPGFQHHHSDPTSRGLDKKYLCGFDIFWLPYRDWKYNSRLNSRTDKTQKKMISTRLWIS